MLVTTASRRPAPLPPRWFVRAAWVGHRAIYSITGGRRGLRSPTAERWGMLRLRTIGRRTGDERIAILGYIEDGSNLVTKAMNGWADPEPAWWLNLLAHPDATVDLVDGPRLVRGRAASGDERTPPVGQVGRLQHEARCLRRRAITPDPGRRPGATVRLTGRGDRGG